MIKLVLLFLFINMMLISNGYTKGSVKIGSDSITIRYDAIPNNNPSDYSLAYKSFYSTKSKLNEKKSNNSLSLDQLSTLSPSSLDTLKGIEYFISNGVLKIESAFTENIHYRPPKTHAHNSLVNGEIIIWGKDQFNNKELQCSISAQQSLVRYLIVKVAIETLGPGKLVDVFVDTKTKQCAGAEFS